jgi:hypothetical protein
MQTPLQVDVTAVILTGLRARCSAWTVRCVTEFPADLEQALPIVRVELAGGGDDGVILDSPTVTWTASPNGTEGSRQFAYRVIGAMYALQRPNRSTVPRSATSASSAAQSHCPTRTPRSAGRV